MDSPKATSSVEEPDDTFLYAVVIGVLYAFIMVFLIFANIHPSRSLLADLERYEGSTDVNLNEEEVLPFELSHLLKADIYDYQFKDPQKLVWPKMPGGPVGRNGRGTPSYARRTSYQKMQSQLTKSAYF